LKSKLENAENIGGFGFAVVGVLCFAYKAPMIPYISNDIFILNQLGSLNEYPDTQLHLK